MMYAAMLSYGLIVRFPPCDGMMKMIWANVGSLSLLYLLYLALLTPINFLVERRMEKRRGSKEYIVLAIAQLIVLAANLAYFSFKFYSHCGEVV